MAGLALVGAVSSSVAQEPTLESANPAAEMAQETVTPDRSAEKPAPAGALESGDVLLPERAEIESRLASATSAASPEDIFAFWIVIP